MGRTSEMTDAGNREKILTFPGFGYLGIAVEIFLKDMGIRYVAVPVNEETEKTEAFRNAPEDMCLPFKLFAAPGTGVGKRRQYCSYGFIKRPLSAG